MLQGTNTEKCFALSFITNFEGKKKKWENDRGLGGVNYTIPPTLFQSGLNFANLTMQLVEKSKFDATD